MENRTTVQWTNEKGPRRTSEKRRKHLEVMWLLAAEDDVFWGYLCLQRTNAGVSYAVTLMDNTRAWKECEDNEENDVEW